MKTAADDVEKNDDLGGHIARSGRTVKPAVRCLLIGGYIVYKSGVFGRQRWVSTGSCYKAGPRY